MIRFLIDDEEIALAGVPADLTVLDWLRLHRGRTGTKEGCGSGDCGACTVLVTSPGDVAAGEPVLRHESINACIAFVGTLHGRRLTTVESLANGSLHPVQRAMVDEHGSQCGFCTPGFVMSMVALCEAPDAPAVRFAHPHGAAGGAPDEDPAGGSGDPHGAGPGRDGAVPTPVAESRSPAVAARAAASDAHADAVVTGTHASAARPVTTPGGWLAGLDSDDALALSHRIDRALGGNLCRCTGYRPIKRAAAVALATHRPLFDEPAAQALAARLRALGGDTAREAETMEAARTAEATALGTAPDAAGDGFHVPRSLEALTALRLAHPEAPLLAGGTDLALEVTQRLAELPRIVLVTRVPELRRLERVGDTLHVGAAVSLSRLVDAFGSPLPDVRALLLRFGSDQIRNAGTIGGNLASASPIGDLAPALLALGASVVLQRGDATRELPLEDFFLGYRRTALDAGELLREVRLPLPAPGALFAVHKVSKRMDDDISAACVAVHLGFEADGATVARARVACGGMAEIPRRAAAVEAALAGRRFDAGNVERAAAAFGRDFTPIDDARASAAYRLEVAGNLLRRTYIEHAALAADAAGAARGEPRPPATHWPGVRLDDGWIRPPTRSGVLDDRFQWAAWRVGDADNAPEGDGRARPRTGTDVLEARGAAGNDPDRSGGGRGHGAGARRRERDR